MRELFVPYDGSLVLKELGFDQPCFTYYFSDGSFNDATEEDYTLYPGDPRFYSDTNSSLANYHKDDIKYNGTTAPLYSQAFDFLLNKIPEYSIRICYNKTGMIYKGNTEFSLFNDLNECIGQLIKIVRDK